MVVAPLSTGGGQPAAAESAVGAVAAAVVAAAVVGAVVAAALVGAVVAAAVVGAVVTEAGGFTPVVGVVAVGPQALSSKDNATNRLKTKNHLLFIRTPPYKLIVNRLNWFFHRLDRLNYPAVDRVVSLEPSQSKYRMG